MTVLNVANKVYLGSSLVSGVYAGTRKVWGPTGRSLLTSYTHTHYRDDWEGAIGITFTLNTPMTFNQMGLYVGAGTPLTAQRARLFVASGAELCRVTVNLTGHPEGIFYYVPIPTVTLASGVNYCMWAEAFPTNGYSWSSGNTTVRNGASWYGGYVGGGGTFDTNTVNIGTGPDAQFFGLDLDYR